MALAVVVAVAHQTRAMAEEMAHRMKTMAEEEGGLPKELEHSALALVS